MQDFKIFSLGEVCKRLSSGKNINSTKIKNCGNYPVYGGNGLRGYTDNFNFYGECAIIGRQGAYCGNVKFFSGKAHMTEHAVVVQGNNFCDTRFLFYLLGTMNLGRLSSQSAQPGLSIKTLSVQKVKLPQLEVQKKIAAVLSCLDDKIELNNKINKNLEQQAQAIFKSWFIDFEPFGGKMPANWKVGKIGDFVKVKRGASPRPIQKYLSNFGLNWLKISDATSIDSPYITSIKEHIKISGLNKTIFLKAGDLVLSNSATPGIPKFLCVDSCIHDGWLFFPESKFSYDFLYLYFKHTKRHLINLGNGTVFTNLKIDIVNSLPINLPDEKFLIEFDKIVVPMFEMIKNLSQENERLAEMRDLLLPRLLNGEIDVSKVEI